MVALASSPPRAAARSLRGAWGWTLAAALVLLIGLGLRLLVGGGGVGDRSALVMGVLLGVSVWLAARLFAGPRAALVAVAAVVVLVDLAGLPARNEVAYDDLQAFYRTDQVLSARLPVPASDVAITLLVEPVFGGDRARFGLAGDLNGSALQWSCPFQHGLQRVALAVPTGLLRGGEMADVRLHLNGTPDRESDYLVAYTSSRLGGFVISLDPAGGSPSTSVTRCSVA